MRPTPLTPSRERCPPPEMVLLATRQLSLMLRGGLSLSRAIRILIRGATGRFREVLEDVYRSLQEGKSFSSALSRHQEIFVPPFVAMVTAGEAAGGLQENLEEMARLQERALWLRRQFSQALLYPSAVLVGVCVLLPVLLYGVLPAFLEIFTQFHGELPWSTRMLIQLLELSRSPLVLWSGGGVLAAALCPAIASRKFPLFLERILDRLPLIGPIRRQAEIARCCRHFCSLLGSGLPLSTTLRVISSLNFSQPFRRGLEEVAVTVGMEGTTLSDAFRRSGCFPSMAVRMLETGEVTGKLVWIFERLGDLYEDEVTRKLNASLALIEPILLTFMGLVVGSILVTCFLPIYSLLLSRP